MTHEQKINYMRIAAGLCCFGFTNQQMDLLVSIYDLVLEKQGNTSLMDTSKVEVDVKKRADIKSKTEMLDKISTKKGETIRNKKAKK